MNIGKRVELAEFAKTIIEGLSDAEKIVVMRVIGFSITSGASANSLTASADEIGRHAHMLARDELAQRSDGTIISPYGAGNGPVRNRVARCAVPEGEVS
ncbi:MAG: hypothetical protein OQK05_00070 [Pseudopelagicola sp.]|nr:hypothetical protein [Pseudopelagicola sp.]